MKLVSINGLGHDLNITYFDGSKLHYVKLERLTGIKHYHQWFDPDFDSKIFKIDRIFDTLTHYFDTYIPELRFNREEITAVCVDSSVCHSNNMDLMRSDSVLHRQINDKMFVVDHHYLHALSVEMITRKRYDCSFVFDARGSVYSYSVFRNNYRVDHCLWIEGSLGSGMIMLGKQMGITGSPLDIAGKLMGLQSYGNIDVQLLNSLEGNYHTIKHLKSKYDFANNSFTDLGIFDISTFANKLDAGRTIHTHCGNLLLNCFLSNAKPHETVSYSGGVAQNVIWNTQLKSSFPNLDILPHCGDEGLSLGGIEFLRRKFQLPPITLENFPYCQSDQSPDFGPSLSTIKQVADLLSKGNTVAWYQGNGEIGPRALGNRSILMDPRIPDGRDKINGIKKREYYRPFGASILEEYAGEYFGINYPNPYMLYTGETKKGGLTSITHVDGTCRAQTVSSNSGAFRGLLEEFHNITGCPVLLNTSLNISGKPIAGKITDALTEFHNTAIDVLVIGDTIYKK